MRRFHESLEGKGEPPPEWAISRLCEEFGCLPGQAIAELETSPWGLVRDIMELRSYARAKELVDNAKREEDLPDSPWVDMVFEIQTQIIRERKKKRGQ